MITLNKVVIVLDPNSESHPALDKVLVLAKLQDFEIKLISCEYLQYLADGYYFDTSVLQELRKEYLVEHKKKLEIIAAPLRENGVTVTTEALWGHPGNDAIVRSIVQFEADLVVHSTRRHSLVSRMFLTNDDWQLVRCCPAPLLLVKDKLWKGRPAILAAVDPKHARRKPQGLDHKVLEYAIGLKDILSGDVFAVHTFTPVPLSGVYPKQARREHEEVFSRLMADFDIPEVQQHLIEESPVCGLRQMEIDLSADVIVMGAISRSLLSDVFIGSTTEKVLDLFESDVLVLKPDGFLSPIR